MSDELATVRGVHIPLGKPGLWAVVDAIDFDKVANFKWHLVKKGRYARSNTHVVMQCLILPPETGKTPDHKDRDGLNNRRNNLRLATSQQQGFNRAKRKGCRSQYQGVSLDKRGKWITSVSANGVRKEMCRFATELEAAHAHDFFAKKIHGDFAVLNFPNE